jgi:hypothetical protein
MTDTNATADGGLATASEAERPSHDLNRGEPN